MVISSNQEYGKNYYLVFGIAQRYFFVYVSKWCLSVQDKSVQLVIIKILLLGGSQRYKAMKREVDF